MVSVGNWCDLKKGYCICLQYAGERVPLVCTALRCPRKNNKDEKR